MSCGICTGADLKVLEATGRLMSWMARYWCSSLAVTRPDFTPSRFSATKSRSAFLYCADLDMDSEGVCQLERAESTSQRSTKERKYTRMHNDGYIMLDILTVWRHRLETKVSKQFNGWSYIKLEGFFSLIEFTLISTNIHKPLPLSYQSNQSWNLFQAHSDVQVITL